MRQRYWWALLVVAAGIALALTLLSVNIWPAHAHMHDRPDLDRWFNSLASSGGAPCCSQVDGSTLADVDWDTSVVNGKSHYRVRIGNEWVVVTDEEVVTGPNMYGRPLVWAYHIDGKVAVRCFMPGGGT